MNHLIKVLLLFTLLLTVGCEKSIYVMHINDVYRIAGVEEGTKGGFARLRTLRNNLEKNKPVLMLHGGDFLFPSLMSRISDGAHMINVMNLLDGSDIPDDHLIVTMGNHEFDKEDLDDASILQGRLDESRFTWLNGNVTWKVRDGKKLISSNNLQPYVTRVIGGVKVGIFGLTINSKIPKYAKGIDNDHIRIAQTMSRLLRQDGHQVIIALTHLKMSEDIAMLKGTEGAGPDVVFGGHEHNKQCQAVGDRLVIKADADARTAAIAKIVVKANGDVSTTFSYEPLDETVEKDPSMLTTVNELTAEFDKAFCIDKKLPPGCLDAEIGKTRVVLEGEELKIRRFETNLGDFIADQALNAYPGTQVAFVNSGGLRLNQDIAAGTMLTERHLREIFQYSGKLYKINIAGRILQQVIDHAVEDWTGNGWWLQIAGFRFTHVANSENGKATNLQMLDNGVYRDVLPDERIVAVTNDFLLAYPRKTEQDGYTMLNASQIVSPIPSNPPKLLNLTRAAIKVKPDGIEPKTSGRITCSGRLCTSSSNSSCQKFKTLTI